jgi:DNA-binding NarL/FixJ family response regulator
MEHFRLTGPANTSEQTLTSREIDVLTLIARGLRNAEVAETLGLADSTIAGYIKSVYRKLGISSRAEAAWHATLMGLTTSNRPKR